MTQAPDIEIYIPKLTTEAAIQWLQGCFSQVQLTAKKKGMPKHAQPILCQHQQQEIAGLVFEKVSGHYTSIWLDSNQLPWRNDQEFAYAAAQHFNCAVRFVAQSWQQQQDPDAWSEITPQGDVQELIWAS
ncbi:hypothetical protein [Reinekea thalattae]|uniref:Uncharacterized protein n=1 Tax=Reinekea thalattae TaxID=2593301 RepID=A0A5C8Z800_9GAMM|nr:hypothetical protein [Reinekea thalattae]TXR53777.1 hypothetical protein FME95_04245 [Reinekea thalattae]